MTCGCHSAAVLAPRHVILARRAVCLKCDAVTLNPNPKFSAFFGLTSRSKCRLCDCLVSTLTKPNISVCPKALWGPA